MCTCVTCAHPRDLRFNVPSVASFQLWASRYRDIDNEELQLKIDAVLRHDEGAHGFFIVPANDLGFSVGVFCSVALLCLLTFGLRRKFAGRLRDS